MHAGGVESFYKGRRFAIVLAIIVLAVIALLFLLNLKETSTPDSVVQLLQFEDEVRVTKTNSIEKRIQDAEQKLYVHTVAIKSMRDDIADAAKKRELDLRKMDQIESKIGDVDFGLTIPTHAPPPPATAIISPDVSHMKADVISLKDQVFRGTDKIKHVEQRFENHQLISTKKDAELERSISDLKAEVIRLKKLVEELTMGKLSDTQRVVTTGNNKSPSTLSQVAPQPVNNNFNTMQNNNNNDKPSKKELLDRLRAQMDDEFTE